MLFRRSAILPLRWPFLPLWAGLIAAAAWAGRRAREADPPPAAAVVPEEAAPEALAEPAPPAAPSPDAAPTGALFAGGLPLADLALPAGLANPTAQGCAACHAGIAAAWEHSAHARAWDGAAFVQAVRDASEPTACLACHLPFAAQHPRRVVALTDGQLSAPRHEINPAWSPTLQREGVTCAACHLRDGAVLGPRAVQGAPHPVTASAELASPALCASCHQLTWPGAEVAWYDTYGEWYRSPYREAGVRCQDCHMPQVAGSATTGRFAAHAAHALAPGPARAVSVLVDLPSPEIVRGETVTLRVRVQNTGAGHAFPTGQPGSRCAISAVVVDARGQPLHDPARLVLARTVGDAPPWALLSDTRIPARGEVVLEPSVTISQKKPAGPARLRVTISRDPGGTSLVERDFPVTVL